MFSPFSPFKNNKFSPVNRSTCRTWTPRLADEALQILRAQRFAFHTRLFGPGFRLEIGRDWSGRWGWLKFPTGNYHILGSKHPQTPAMLGYLLGADGFDS